MLKTSHVLLLLGVVIIWGVNFTMIKIGLDHFPPIFFNALRFIIIGLFILVIPRPKVPVKNIIAIGLSFGVIKLSLLMLGMSFGVGAGVSSVMLQSQVFFTILVCAVVFKEKVTWSQFAGISLGAVGILLILNAMWGQGATFTGLLLIILAGFAWAITNAILKTTSDGDALGIIVWSGAVSALPLLALSVLLEDTSDILSALRGVNLAGASAAFYVSVISTILGFATWGRMLARYPAAQVVPFALLVPVAGFLSGAIFLEEELHIGTLIGAGFIIGGIAVGQYGSHPKVRRFIKLFSGG